MTPAAASFNATLAANAAHHGAQQQVTIAGTDYDAIIEEIASDEIVVLGGTGERGGFRAHCRVSDFASQPTKFAEISYDGTELRILSVVKTNQAVYTFVAGDPVTNE